jgi:gliding motility associated protien GldN
LFNYIIKGKITAYRYDLDGIEHLTPDYIIAPIKILDNNNIYYEEKNGEFIVGKSDIPSAEVLSYYIKELYYYDQRTGTYGTRVTAICPVLHSLGDIGDEVTKFPMFWVKYDDISALLAQQLVMTSSLNNVMSMTLDDYFKRGCYHGEIYNTLNMHNLAISQYCNDSTEIKQEQDKIEQQLKDFEANLWSTKTVAEMRQDSIKAANDTIKTDKKEKSVEKSKAVRTTTANKNQKSVSKKSSTSKPREQATSRSNSGTVSVRRTRR